MHGLRDRAGRLLFSEGVEDEQALAGHNVYLTIDKGIQFTAERELEAAMKTYEAIGGSIVAVDPSTGEILAMASAPGFNPNDYGAADPDTRRNRAVADRFEPGSSMKVFMMASALAAKSVAPTRPSTPRRDDGDRQHRHPRHPRLQVADADAVPGDLVEHLRREDRARARRVAPL